MTITRKHRRPWLALAALALSAAMLAAACGDNGDDSGGGGGGDESGSEAPETITIAYQAIPNGDLVVKHEGWLEEAFPDTEIEWKLFESGGDVNEAVAADAVDIGLVGSSPASRGISQGLAYEVPWIFDVIGAAEALVVKEDIGSIEDLKGKTVATPLASTSHFSLLAALEDAGVDLAEVKIIDAAPDDIYAAWTRGDIDGAYIWNPNLAKLQDEGGKVLIDSAELAEKGTTTYDLAVVTSSFAEEHPAAVQTWVEQQNRAVELITSDPDTAAEAIAAELNITPDEAASQIEDLIFLDAAEQAGADYLGGGLADNLFATAEFNKELGQIDSVKPESAYADAVLSSFAQKAAEG